MDTAALTAAVAIAAALATPEFATWSAKDADPEESLLLDFVFVGAADASACSIGLLLVGLSTDLRFLAEAADAILIPLTLSESGKEFLMSPSAANTDSDSASPLSLSSLFNSVDILVSVSSLSSVDEYSADGVLLVCLIGCLVGTVNAFVFIALHNNSSVDRDAEENFILRFYSFFCRNSVLWSKMFFFVGVQLKNERRNCTKLSSRSLLYSQKYMIWRKR